MLGSFFIVCILSIQLQKRTREFVALFNPFTASCVCTWKMMELLHPTLRKLPFFSTVRALRVENKTYKNVIDILETKREFFNKLVSPWERIFQHGKLRVVDSRNKKIFAKCYANTTRDTSSCASPESCFLWNFISISV